MLVNKVSEVMGRRRMGITDLARAAGISRQTAHRLYYGATDVNLTQIEKVCDALGVPVSDVLEWVPGDRQSETGGEDAGARARVLAGG